ncbi:hypothetical protein V3F56_08175 [Moorellaceae bacterium AZ2]
MPRTKAHKRPRRCVIPKAQPPKKKAANPFLDQELLESIRKRDKEPIVFSFQFFDRKHERFNLGGIDGSWFVGLLDALADITSKNRHEFIQDRQHYRPHKHDWNKLDTRYNLPPEVWEQIGEDGTIQFRLTKSSGRVHGFMIGNRFYVVWLDPHHNLYPSEKHGGVHHYEPCLSEYELKCLECQQLQEQLDKCKQENKELLNELEKYLSS